MKHLSILFSFTLLLLLIQCAKQTSPTGGPKDETPPKLLSSTLAKNPINFKGNEIELVFDEFVQINNPREQVIITPSIGKKFELTARKNKILLKLNAALQDSTTYTINFREAIQDLTEKNPAKDLKLAFSTGHHIDSLSIKGTVTDLLSDTKMKDYTVALVPASDTFDIFKHPAQWLSITDKDGNFSIENLKAGNYLLYAIDDKNKNLIIDSKNEAYGFVSGVTRLSTPLNDIQIQTFKLDTRPFKIISARPLSNYHNIKTTKSIVEYSIKPANDSITIFSKLTDLTNVKVYNTNPELDSTAIYFSAKDSAAFTVDTVFYIKFDTRPSLKRENFTTKVESVEYFKSTNQLISKLAFSKPVAYMNFDSIYYQLDSLTIIPIKKEQVNWSLDQSELSILIKPEQEIQQQAKSIQNPDTKSTTRRPQSKDTSSDTIKGKSSPTVNKLILKNQAFTSIENDSSKQQEQPIKIITPQETGVIIAEVKSSEQFIIQLLDQKFNIIREIYNQPKHRFENLPPTSYYLRLIIDKNKNGKWDPGNFYTGQPPEQILFYKNEKSEKLINIKANWELGPLLITHE
jgi:uncharacterized protein (DUF2141 family)